MTRFFETGRAVHHRDTAVAAGLAAGALLGVGMLLMYFLDPQQGRRRRALVTDRMAGTERQVSDSVGVAARDAANRASGAAARMKSSLFERGGISDERLVERVRSRIGRAVSNPHAIEVQAHQGRITLRGPVLKRELKALMSAVWNTRGVEDVDCQVELHEQAGRVPSLQLEESSQEESAQRSRWRPATRLVAGATGTGAALLGMRYRPWGLIGAVIGSALVARAIGNRSLREISRLGPPESVHVEKEIYIEAPPEQVFQFWRRQENFPNFMRNVREVERLGERRYRWKVAGPMGSRVEWESMITEEEENRRMAWSTAPGSSVQHCGVVEFVPEGNGTRVRVTMDYTPKAGVFGDSFARLLRRDAKSEMDGDMMRVKSFLETGTPAQDAARGGYAQEPRSIH